MKTALELLKQNEQLTMNELEIEMKKKYPTFDITPQHLGQVIRDNNKYTLTQKDDCNLELTDDKNNSIWTSKTKNKGTSCYTKIDNDNKLVVYDSYNTPLFTSKNTRGSSLGGISFNLNDDRNMTITDAYNNILWNSETTYHPPPSLSPPQLQKKTNYRLDEAVSRHYYL